MKGRPLAWIVQQAPSPVTRATAIVSLAWRDFGCQMRGRPPATSVRPAHGSLTKGRTAWHSVLHALPGRTLPLKEQRRFLLASLVSLERGTLICSNWVATIALSVRTLQTQA